MRHHHHLRTAPTITHRVAEHLARAEAAVMGGQIDALAQLGHHRIPKAMRSLGQLSRAGFSPCGVASSRRPSSRSLQQRGGADLLDALKGIGNGR